MSLCRGLSLGAPPQHAASGQSGCAQDGSGSGSGRCPEQVEAARRSAEVTWPRSPFSVGSPRPQNLPRLKGGHMDPTFPWDMCQGGQLLVTML